MCVNLEKLKKKKIALKFHFQNLVTVKKTHQFMFSYRGRRGLVCHHKVCQNTDRITKKKRFFDFHFRTGTFWEQKNIKFLCYLQLFFWYFFF